MKIERRDNSIVQSILVFCVIKIVTRTLLGKINNHAKDSMSSNDCSVGIEDGLNDCRTRGVYASILLVFGHRVGINAWIIAAIFRTSSSTFR